MVWDAGWGRFCMIPAILGSSAGNSNQRRPRTWRRTAKEVGLAANQSAANAFYYYGSFECWSNPPGVYGKLTLPWQGYATWPIYNAADATTTVKAWWYTYDLGYFTDGSEIPWNPAWLPAQEGDAGLLIDDNMGGGEFFSGYELWYTIGTSTRPWVFDWLDWAQNVYQRGWRYGDLLAGTIVRRTETNGGAYIGRGAGNIPKRSMILTGSEVAEAVANNDCIHHALAAVGVNMQAGSYAVSNNLYSAPGTRIEHVSNQPASPTIPNSPNSNLFNEGTRFALQMSDSEIESWLDSRSYSGALRSTAKAIAKTLVNYGWICVETGTGQPQIECDSIGPGYPSSSTWNSLGITSQSISQNLLNGLLTSSNIVVLKPESMYQ